MGYQIKDTISKTRESYVWVYNLDEGEEVRRVKLEFDKIFGVPMWMEVEARNEEELEAAIKKLGFSLDRLCFDTMGELVKKYIV